MPFLYPSVIIALVLVTLPADQVLAAPLRVNDKPTSISEVQTELQNIENDLSQAHCGGWFNWADDVTAEGYLPEVQNITNPDDTLGLKIADVIGVPGRDGFILDNIESGMARRDDENFIGPGDENGVWGFRTACRVGNPDWFETLPCQRPLGGHWEEHTETTPRGTVTWSCGGAPMPDDGFVNNAFENPPGAQGPAPDPIGNTGMCSRLNTHWLYIYYEKHVPHTTRGCGEPQDDADKHGTNGAICSATFSIDAPCKLQTVQEAVDFANNNPPPEANYEWKDVRYCCSKQSAMGKISHKDGIDGGNLQDGNGELLRNCETCIGAEECRTCDPSDPNCPFKNPEKPRRQFLPPWRSERKNCENINYDANGDGDYDDVQLGEFEGITCPHNKPSRPRYKSFYRFYLASYEREPFVSGEYMPIGRDDYKKWDIPVSCYGLYGEFDPKDRRVPRRHKRCVIAAYYNDTYTEELPDGSEVERYSRSFRDMRESQRARGVFRSNWQDVPPKVRSLPFDQDEDLWYTELSNTFSISNGKVFKDRYNEDITMMLYQPSDITHLEAMHVQTSGALMRAFDDTVHNDPDDNDHFDDLRSVTESWQINQTRAHKIAAPYTVRVLIPPAWSLGLDTADPLFTPALSGAVKDPRNATLELQIDARENLVDEIKGFLKRMLLLKVEEEPIPIVVPLASSTELRAHAEGWQRWIQAKEFFGDTPPPEALELVEKLEEYARKLDQVRLIRTELSLFAGKLFRAQTEIDEAVGGWLNEDVIAKYEVYRRSLQDLEALMRLWSQTQRHMRQATDIHSLPWCHNDRFTVPIYSLLDWWLATDSATPRDRLKDGLPRLDEEDLPSAQFDFTALRAATGAIRIPVFSPIQIRIADTAPPEILEEGVDIPVLPDLPGIPELADPSLFIPTIFTGSIATKPPGIGIYAHNREIMDATTKMEEIRSLASKMKKEYKKFWESTQLVLPDNQLVSAQDCYAHHEDECVHAEMDLHERIMRFGSRPMVHLYEDFLSIGYWRPNPADNPLLNILNIDDPIGYDERSCPEEDWTCQLLRESEKKPRSGWTADWKGEFPSQTLCNEVPAGTDTIALQRACAVENTLRQDDLDDDELIPLEGERAIILPSFAVPETFDIHQDRLEEETPTTP